jgi:uroporphyrinogen decarboxylase
MRKEDHTIENTSYERVKAALEHREPDRIPFEIGGTGVSGINRHAYVRLRRYLGMPEIEIEIFDLVTQLARVDDDMVERLGIDVKAVKPDTPYNKGLATDVVRDGAYDTMTDEWGVKWKKPIDGGHYFDMYDASLKHASTPNDLEQFPWPDFQDETRYATIKQKADTYVHTQKKAYVLERDYGGIWETALWTCGFEKFFLDMVGNKPFAHALLEKITELKMQFWEKAIEAAGENILIISEADDLAAQNSLLCSPRMYKQMVHPYHKQLFEFIKKQAEAQTGSRVYLFYHTCGAVKPLIPLLIEEGVDILNPVQVNAKDMDTKALKREFGKDITFWGGGVDTQRVLPFGTPAQVKDEVKRRIEELAPCGGFVFTTVHNVQSDVSPENFMAMWETLQEYGKY